MLVFAIDPGPTKSGYVWWDGEKILDKGKDDNFYILKLLKHLSGTSLVIEKIESYGMAVGKSTFETVFWSGRFAQAYGKKFYRLPRRTVKLHICRSSKAKDSNIRQALIDRFEPDLEPRKRPKGILKDVSMDMWSALALAVTFHDLFQEKGGDLQAEH